MREAILKERVLKLFWLKLVGSTVVISLFFVAYFYVLNHPVRPIRAMPLLGVDRSMPVIGLSLWAYVSLWVYICLPSSLMRNAAGLRCYVEGAFLLSLVGIAVFWLYPTSVPNWGIDWAAYPGLYFLKESDAAGNACPSLHVGFAVFSGLWLDWMLRRVDARRWLRAGNLLWCVLIVISTMTTKQHVLIDVACGVVLGVLVFWSNQHRTLRQEVSL